MKNIYFNPNAKNPLELAEINKVFYANLIAEYKSCSAHKFLWTGIQLQNLINDIKKYQVNAPKIYHNKCNAMIEYYKTLYNKLTNGK